MRKVTRRIEMYRITACGILVKEKQYAEKSVIMYGKPSDKEVMKEFNRIYQSEFRAVEIVKREVETGMYMMCEEDFVLHGTKVSK